MLCNRHHLPISALSLFKSASRLLSVELLQDAILSALTKGPAPKSECDFYIAELKDIPEDILGCFSEMQAWEAADFLQGSDETMMLISKGVTDLFIKAIKLLLEALMSSQELSNTNRKLARPVKKEINQSEYSLG